MAKRSNYVCQQCGYSQVGWAGKCPNCGTWGSLVETLEVSSFGSKKKSSNPTPAKTATKLSEVKSGKIQRLSTEISELDRVLGGGLVPGQVVLLAGEPGIGKSTILLQVANNIKNTFYVSGEESAIQVKIRADRLGIKSENILFLESTDVDQVLATLDGETSASGMIIIDSIQTMATGDLAGMAGSVGQVRECTSRLLGWAKANNVPLVIVGHVTKEGTVAGPAVLAHLVDSVLWFEGDKSLAFRMLRAVKNRFGPTDEVGIFTMESEGLRSSDDISTMFLSQNIQGVAGAAIASVLEGTRPILVEVQSLSVPSKLVNPRRTAQGIDSRRVELILAVLARRCGIKLFDYDVFVNVAGGVTVREPAVDLAVALSIASGFFDKPLPSKLVVVGEVGLMGELRDVPRIKNRISEAKRLGYTQFATKKEFNFLNQAIAEFFKK